MSDEEVEDLGGAAAGMGGNLSPLNSASTGPLRVAGTNQGEVHLAGRLEQASSNVKVREASKDPHRGFLTHSWLQLEYEASGVSVR